MKVEAHVKKVVGQPGGPVDLYLLCPAAAEGIMVVNLVSTTDEELPSAGDTVTLEVLRAKTVEPAPEETEEQPKKKGK